MSVFLAVVLLVMAAALLGVIIFHLYVLPVRRMARETRLIANANRSYRIDAHKPPPLGSLAAAINELAERSEAAQQDVEGKIAAAGAELEEERNRFAALMSELTLAVLVCNVEGQILLYNAAARDLFGEGGRASGLVGLGRSIFAILDRSLLAHVLERVARGARKGGTGAAVRLAATGPDGQLLRTAAAPVRGADGDLAGVVLTLEDVTRSAEASAQRDALLRSLTEGTRASIASIRAAIEALLDYPGMEAAERERFMAIVRNESVALGSRVEGALSESAAHLRSEWRLAEILGRDLLAALQRRLESELGLTAPAEEVNGELWLDVDSYAVAQAVTHLARRLRAEAAAERVSLAMNSDGRHAHLDLRWDGRPPDEERLRSWTEQPLGGGAPSTVRDVVERHGGEVWCQVDPGGGAYVRLVLPVAEATPDTPGEAAERTASAAESRPEFYDFDLFRPAAGAREQDERALDELTYTVFDTETTGLNPSAGDEIISIGAVRVVNRRLLRQETFDRLIDPRRPLSPLSVRVHGIGPELLEGKPTIDEVLPLFARFCQDTVLVGHDVGFDLRFLELKEERTGVRLAQPVLDTLLLDAVVAPDEADHSLESMAARLGVSVIGRHTALGDAILTAEIFLRQLRLLAAQGISTLGQARQAARGTHLARVGDSLYSRT